MSRTWVKITNPVCLTVGCNGPTVCKNLCKPCYDRQHQPTRTAHWKIVNQMQRKKATSLGICNKYGCKAKAAQHHKMCVRHLNADRKAKKQYRKLHPERIAANRHQRVYHEPFSNKIARLDAQGNKCANPACRTSNPGKNGWHTDHNHETGLIRGELCGHCNNALGLASDSSAILRGLATYRESYP
jgi:hypothetical protein